MTALNCIRSNIIKDSIERHEAACKGMMQCLKARDEAQQRLNQEFGFSDSDGSIGSGKMSYREPEYVRQYDEIQNNSKAQYEAFRATEDARDQQLLSAYEYLLFDNASTEAVKELYTLASQNLDKTLPTLAFLSARARGEIRRWRDNEYNIEEMMRREKLDFSYRASRCRKFLGAKSLDPRSQIAISKFEAEYITQLEKELSGTEFQSYSENLRSERADSSRWTLTLILWGVGAYVIYKTGVWVDRQSDGWSDLANFIICRSSDLI